MPEISPSVNTISNPAKILRAYMKATGQTNAAALAELLDIPVRTIRRLKLEAAEADETANSATSAIYGRAKAANSATDGRSDRETEVVPACENNSTRDCIEEPTVLSSSPQQQQADDPLESGLLSLLKAEMNLYTQAEAKTQLLSQFRAYGEKNFVDAYSAYVAERSGGREFVKPLKYIQQTARALRDAPPPTPNVVAFRRNPNVPTIAEALAAMEAAQ